MYISNYRRRSDAVFLLFLAFFLICICRLLFIQFFRSSYLAEIARKQHNMYVELEPARGTIYDSALRQLAVNIPTPSLYASPNEMADKDKDAAVRKLSSVLNLSPSFLKDRIYRKKSFIWLARKLNPEQAQAVKALNLKGLGFLKESRRSYPDNYLAAHVIGFAGLDNNGLEGLEAHYDKYLKGESGWAVFLRDARQKKLDIWERMVLPKNGYDLILTIDSTIQYIAERELDKAYETNHARGASIIVMDPHTGAILAMANRPTYDPNASGQANKDQVRNRAVCDLYEPGSVFKIVTASAAIEERKVDEADRFFCENGTYRVANHILHDHTPHGWLTFREVIEESSNIGTTKIAQKLGAEIVYKYARLFGFGTASGIDLAGEINGMLKEPRYWSKTSIGAVPIGQEVGVTTIQLANAISVIANGGQLMRPYVVQEIRDRYGEVIKKNSPQMVRKVISLDTADRVKKILVGVIEEGTGKMAQILGMNAAGKTGTAQKLEADGSYSHNKFMASFIGFAPAEDPLVAIAVTVDEPRPYYFGGVVAAPVFKNVAADAVRYLKSNQLSSDNINKDDDKKIG